MDIITKDINELQIIVREKKAKLQKEQELVKDAGRGREREKVEKDKELEREQEKDKQPEVHKDKDTAENYKDKMKDKTEPNGVSSGKVI